MEMKKLTIYVLGILKAQLCITLASSVPLYVERRTCFIIGVEFLHGDTMGKKEIAHVPSSPLRWYELVWLSSSPTVWLYLICLAFVNLEVLYNISFQIDFLYKLYIGKQVQR